jgi:phosphoglucosamine mutase
MILNLIKAKEIDHMSRKLFGTDGIRGKANHYPMTTEIALSLGKAMATYLKQSTEHKPKVVIGKDTRISGYMIENALVSGLCAGGADVYLVGPLPTPAVAFLTVSRRADAGMMISASHNPYEDNGIKIFNRDGYKLADEVELFLENLIENPLPHHLLPTGDQIGRAYRIEDAVGRYNVFAKNAFPQSLTLEGLKIVVDCANGAAYKVAPEVLSELGAQVIPIAVHPNGTNINDHCGATHPDLLANEVIKHQADVGIALDGDADRCVIVDEKGQILDGDQLLVVLARFLQSKNQLKKQTVVSTVMSNLGLEKALLRLGIQVQRVGVGDRYVIEKMRSDGFNLGGEQSGHVILNDFATTGDGLITALAMLAVLVAENKKMSELGAEMPRFPQILKNIDVPAKTPLTQLDQTSAIIASLEQELGQLGRILVRYSGTQMQLRVMVEGEEQSRIEQIADLILDTYLKEITPKTSEV